MLRIRNDKQHDKKQLPNKWTQIHPVSEIKVLDYRGKGNVAWICQLAMKINKRIKLVILYLSVQPVWGC